MPRNIYGLDIGESSIKLAKFNKSLSGYKFITFKKKGYLNDESLDNAPVALGEILGDVKIAVDDYVAVSISSRNLIVRNMTLPFTDLKKIRSLIKYEIEPDTLFTAEALIVDFTVIKKDKKKKTCELIVCAIEKHIIEKYLSIFNEHNIEPDILDIDCFSLANSFSVFKKEQKISLKERFFKAVPMEGVITNNFSADDDNNDGVISMIDIGAEKTIINILDNGKLIFTRTFPKAGNFISQNIMKVNNISFEEAERLKLKISKANDSTVLKEISKKDPFTYSVSLILKEIDLTFLSYYAKSKEGKQIQTIYLTGGSANIQTFLENLKAKYNVSVLNYSLREKLEDSTYDMYDSQKLYTPIAVGLAMRGIKKTHNTINLRKEEFSYKGSYESVKGNIIFVSIATGLLVLLAFFNFYYHLNIKEKKYYSLKTKAKRIFKQALPDTNLISGISELRQMQSKIEENKARLKDFGGAGLNLSSLEILREISAYISKDIKIDISEMIISQEKINLEATTDSFDAVDDIKMNIEKSDFFETFKVSRSDQKDNAVEFRATILLKGKL